MTAVIAGRQATYAGLTTRELYVEGGGPCVVLVHGFADCADTWCGVLTELAEAGRAAVAVDLPGFGHADPLPPGSRLGQLDGFIAEVLAAHGESGAIVVGNSLGGALAVRAAQQPNLPVVGVVPVCTVGMGFALGIRFASVGNGVLVNGFTRVPLPNRLVVEVARRSLPRLMYGDPHAADPAVIERMCMPFAHTGSAAAFLQSGTAYSLEVRDCLQPEQVLCPMTVVHGERDRLVPVTASRRLHAAVPHSSLMVLPEAGHCPQLDEPRTIARIVCAMGTPVSRPD